MVLMPKPLPVISPVPDASVCCSPLVDSPLTAEESTELAGRLKALADPTRIRMLSIMLASRDLEACTCDLTEPLELSQPTVSHHLKKLAAAGLVVPDRRVGSFTYYRVVPEALSAIADVLAPPRP